jgi:hypothetical protein
MKILFFLVVFLSASPLLAEKLDKNSQEALEQTLGILRSSQKRGEEIKNSPKAKAADAEVKALTGNEKNTEKLYELSAQIMQDLVTQANGDPDKMVKILEQAQKDPAGFAKTFSPEQQKLLKELAVDIEKTKGTKSVP